MNRTARYIASGVLTILLAAAVGAGLYLLASDPSGGNSRAKTLFAFAPAAMFAWLLSRLWPKSVAVHGSVPPVDPHLVTPLEEPDEPYTFIGACAPSTAEALLAQLKEHKVRFLIDLAGPRRPRLGGSSRGSPNPVQIFVHNDDISETESVLSSLGMKFGTL
jgi:hypothetical protein